MTFFSLPSIFTFLPPSLAKPGTAATGAGGAKLNVYDPIRSSVVHADTLRARKGNWAAVPVVGPKKPPLSPGPPVLGIFGFGDPVRLILSSSYWGVQCTIAPTSTPASRESAGPS